MLSTFNSFLGKPWIALVAVLNIWKAVESLLAGAPTRACAYALVAVWAILWVRAQTQRERKAS